MQEKEKKPQVFDENFNKGKQYDDFFCPFQSSASIPVKCDSNCALFVTETRLFGFGNRTKFAGCSLKLTAMNSSDL